MNERPADSWFTQLLVVLKILLLKWKRIVLITFLFFVGAIIGVLLAKEEFRASSTLMLESSSNKGLGSLGSLMSGDLGALMGMKMGGSPDLPLLDGLLQSRKLRIAAVEKFQLIKEWELDTTNLRWENVDKIWGAHFSGATSEEKGIDISFTSGKPVLSKAVVDFVTHWLDSCLNESHQTRSRLQAKFVFDRIHEREVMLKDAQNKLIEFQKATKVFMPAEQISQAVLKTADLEAQIQKLDFQIGLTSEESGSSSASVQALKHSRARLAQLLNSVLSNKQGEDGSGKGFVLRNLPGSLKTAQTYEELFRAVEVHRTVLTYLIQAGEQSQIESHKDLPILVTVDPALVPTKRSSPARMALVQMFTLLGFCFSCGTVLFQAKMQEMGYSFKRLMELLRQGTW